MKFVNFKRFQRDVEGGITLFIIGMFLLMVVAGGMAVDFMRHESERVRFQDAMDRGVLSAASLRQVDEFGVEYNDPTDVVTSYLRAEGYEVNSPGMAIAVRTPASNNVSSRQVDAAAEFSINTFFLRLINIPTMSVAAYSSAAVEYSRVELSLVLDVSGSMGRAPDACNSNCTDKIDSLKIAAVKFVNQVITDDNIDRTTMSIVPFSATVNPGEQIAEEFTALNRWHSYGPCFDFARPGDSTTTGNDFLTTAMAPTDFYQQSQHYSISGNSTDWCPGEANEIVALSNNRNLLEYTIWNLEEELYTSQYMGVKWGAALLNPAFNPITIALTNKSQTIPVFNDDGVPTGGTESVSTVESLFVDRPTQFVDGANKYLVLMSDGDNTMHTQINPLMYNQAGTGSWRTQANADWWNSQNNNYNQFGWYYQRGSCRQWDWWGNCREYNWNLTLGNSTRSDSTPEPRTNFNDSFYIHENNNSHDIDADFHIDPNESDELQEQICSALKVQGVRVFTIGFDIDSPLIPEGQVLTPDDVDDLSTNDYRAYKALYRCASNGADFFLAEDEDELEEAFEAIATNVARLRLLD